jgi:hypothetical protein
MRWLIALLSCLCLAAPVRAEDAVSGRVLKVLPLFMDLKGRTQTTPSLYDRDAYQAMLRSHPTQRTGIEFAIEWKAKGPKGAQLKLRFEARGGLKAQPPTQVVLEEAVTPTGMFGAWTSLKLTGEAYKKFGDVSAWRASLWDGARLVHEEKSFLWEGEMQLPSLQTTNALPPPATVPPGK